MSHAPTEKEPTFGALSGGQRRPADRLAGGEGARRRDDDAGHVVDHHRRLPAPRRDRKGSRRGPASPPPARSSVCSPPASCSSSGVGVRSSSRRPSSRSSLPWRQPCSPRIPGRGARSFGPPRGPVHRDRGWLLGPRDHRGQREGLDRTRRHRRHGDHRARSGRVRLHGHAVSRAAARPATVRRRGFRAGAITILGRAQMADTQEQL